MPDANDDKIAPILAYLRQAFGDAGLSHGWADAHTYEFRMVHGGLVHKVQVLGAFLDVHTPDGITVFVQAHRLSQVIHQAAGRPVRISRWEGITIEEQPPTGFLLTVQQRIESA